eukprot:5560585-Pyramimonas_sp.AAC.3
MAAKRRHKEMEQSIANDKLVLMEQYKKLESKESALLLLRKRYVEQAVRNVKHVLQELIGRVYLPMSQKSAHSFTCNPY